MDRDAAAQRTNNGRYRELKTGGKEELNTKRFLALSLSAALVFSAEAPISAFAAKKTSVKKQLEITRDARMRAPQMHFDGTLRAYGTVAENDAEGYASSVVVAGKASSDYITVPVFAAHISGDIEYIVEDTGIQAGFQAYIVEDKDGYELYTGKRLPDASDYITEEIETKETASDAQESETEEPQTAAAYGKPYKDKDGFTWEYSSLDKTTGDYLQTLIKAGKITRYLEEDSEMEEKDGAEAIEKTLDVMDIEKMINDNASLINLFGEGSSLSDKMKEYLPYLDGIKLKTELLTDKGTGPPKSLTISAEDSDFRHINAYLSSLLNQEEVSAEETENAQETEAEAGYGLTFSALGNDVSANYTSELIDSAAPPDILKGLKGEEENSTEAETEKEAAAATEETIATEAATPRKPGKQPETQKETTGQKKD